MVVSAAASTSKDGEEVFSESRSLLFKSLKVKRLVDKEGESIVYAVFSQRLDKNEDANNSRFKSALCAVRSPHRTRGLPPSHRSPHQPLRAASQVHVDKFEEAAPAK